MLGDTADNVSKVVAETEFSDEFITFLQSKDVYENRVHEFNQLSISKKLTDEFINKFPEGYETKAGDLISFVKTTREPHVKPIQLASKDEVDVSKYVGYVRRMSARGSLWCVSTPDWKIIISGFKCL